MKQIQTIFPTIAAMAFCLLTLLAPTAPASAQDSAIAAPGLIVVGTGTVTIVPDIARLNLGVQTQGKDAVATAQTNARRTAAVVQAIKATGVAAADIATLDYTMEPIEAQKQGAKTTVGYTVSNTVSVVVRKIGSAGKVFDAALKMGANVAGGITFTSSQPQKAREEALMRAITDATGKAKLIAKATGLTTIRLGTFVETGDSYATRNLVNNRIASAFAGYDGSETPVSGGMLRVTVTVIARYEISATAIAIQ